MVDIWGSWDTISTILIGAFFSMIAFSHKELRAARWLLLVGSFVVTIRWVSWSLATDSSWITRSIVGASFGALLLGGVPALLTWSHHRDHTIQANTSSKHTEKKAPISFRDLFDRDFVGLGAIGKTLDLTNSCNTNPVHIPVRLLFDYVSRTTALAVYVENTVSSNQVYDALLNNRTRVLAILNESSMQIEIPGDTSVISTNKFKFSESIYFYMEKDLNLQQQAAIQLSFQAQGVTANFRGRAYYVLNWHQPIVSQVIRMPAVPSQAP